MVIALRNFWVVMRYLTCYNECNYRNMKYNLVVLHER